MSKATRLVATLAGSAAVTVALLTMTRSRFERRISGEAADLLATAGAWQTGLVTEMDLEGLPEPVQRWLRYSQVIGKPRPTTVRLRQEGEFRTSADAKWMPFEAEEYYTIDPPAFIWIARMQMAPGVTINGRDRYQHGHGSIDMRLLGLIPVAREAGPKLNHGALLRYLNETMWFPAAALAPYISWEAIDANSARATMTYGGISAPATFIFDDQGRLTNMIAERYYLAGDELETWQTPIYGYDTFGGVRVSSEGEGIWKLDSGDFAYIRLHLTDLEYDEPSLY